MAKMLDRERLVLEVKRASGPAAALLVLIIIAIVCVAVILKNIGVSLPWSSSYQRQVLLDNAHGVVPNADTVRLAGVTVGRITGINLRGGRPVATISIDPKYAPLYRNAQLRVRPETPLDDMYLDIVSRGTPSAGALPANDVLPAQRTQVPVDISNVLDVFNANTRAAAKASIDTLGAALGPAGGTSFKQALVELAPFLAAAKRITYETSIRQTETAQLVHNFELLTGALGQRDTQVRQLVASGASTLSELGNNESSVNALVGQLAPTMSQLESTFTTLRATENHLDPAFEALQPVARQLPSGLAGLERFGRAAEPALARLRAPLPNLNLLVSALRPTAAGLRSSFTGLKAFPAQANTITGLVLPCEPALERFFTNTMSVSKYYDRFGVIIRGLVVAGLQDINGAGTSQTVAQSCVPGAPGRTG
ncbi:MAG TPA: MlaD family protein [Solirubrobacteraceae bacterium]|nr:MlaD family protein [Solirubrobacteraceae bacterium]